MSCVGSVSEPAPRLPPRRRWSNRRRRRPTTTKSAKRATSPIPRTCRTITASIAIRNRGGRRADQKDGTSGAPRRVFGGSGKRARPRSPQLFAPLGSRRRLGRAWRAVARRGSHCAKGASVRELVSGERRLKYPMKMAGGKCTRISWDQAINEIGDKILDIRGKSGPDSVYWLGSAKMTNEGSYLFRKLGAFWGTNNTDHQARICHSTTVTGVANTWGYGAMTNSINDMRNAKT